MTEKQRLMTLDWMRKIHILEHAHRLESLRWTKLNSVLGIPALLLGSFIGIISSICDINHLLFVTITSAIGGFVVAAITAIQTFLKPMKISEKHMNTSGVYEKLRHKIEFVLQFKYNSEGIENQIDELREEWEQIQTLNVNQKNFKTAKSWISKMNKYPKELEFLD